ncbi:hypothetical protein [Microcoleus sp. B9-D4]|uniref:hypothetical protein n=1 Tax=Microcoleus sp. B9-D4 TaxID=2818711 RepID=UPI002FCECA3D
MMIRRLALVSGLAVLSAVAFASQAGAQAVPQDVQFGGNITGTCTFTGTTPGTLAAIPNNPWVEASTGTTIGTTGTAGQTTVNCTSGGALSVAAPVRLAAPPTFVDTAKQAVVYDATANAFTSSAGAPFNNSGWLKPTTALTIPANTNRVLRVGMITGLNSAGAGAVPTGTYTYRVTLTATPN